MLPMELLISRLHFNGLNKKINVEQKKTSPLHKVLHYNELTKELKMNQHTKQLKHERDNVQYH